MACSLLNTKSSGPGPNKSSINRETDLLNFREEAVKQNKLNTHDDVHVPDVHEVACLNL